MTTLLETLSSLTKVTRENEESDAGFLDAMVGAINDLDEENWDKLPEEAKSWFNEAAKIIQDADDRDYTLPLLPGMELGDVEVPTSKKVEEVEEVEEIEEQKETKEVKEKAATKVARKKRVGPPVTQLAREMFCEDISMSLETLLKKLEEAEIEIKKSTAQVVYLNTLRAMETAMELGEVKKEGKVVLKAV